MTTAHGPRYPAEVLLLLAAALFLVAGLFFVLAGIGVLKPRTMPPDASAWLIGATGGAFSATGAALLLAVRHARRWAAGFPFRIVRYVGSLAVVGALAATGTWLFFQDNPQHAGGAGIGRFIFGGGAVVCWASFLWHAVRGWRDLRRRPNIRYMNV